MPALTLSRIPGFADVPDLAFAHDILASGVNVARISENATFGMERFETFEGLYKDGDTVPLPISNIDGNPYERSELLYDWGIQSSLNQSSGWRTGPDALWYCAYDVVQYDDDPANAGKVQCLEYYRRSGDDLQAAQSNDGLLHVITIAQRRRTQLTLAVPASAYVDVDDSLLVTDAPFTQEVAQGLNRNAKFSVLNAEAIDMGEFVDGDTVPLPISPADGYTYTRAECRMKPRWRWTTTSTSFIEPDKALGQLGPMKTSVDQSTGAVSVSVEYVNDEDTTLSTHGRIAVMAYCSRSDLIDTIPSTADDFAEIDPTTFMPGETLRASTLIQVNKNIREAACSPEFFGPDEYATSDVIPAPTSTLDGYVYSRDELQYSWEWSDTSNETGDNLRAVGWYANVGPLGNVQQRTWRLPPGGPWVETSGFSKIVATVIAIRKSTRATITPPDPGAPTGDTTPTDTGGGSSGGSGDGSGSGGGTGAVTVNEPYQISYYSGQDGSPIATKALLVHPIGGLIVTGAKFPAGLAGSTVGAVVAPASDWTMTIMQGVAADGTGGASVGTATIAAGAHVGTWDFPDDILAAPTELWAFLPPGTPDGTISQINFSMCGVRAAGGTINSTPGSPGTTTPGVGDDMLDWMLNTDRANSHLTGTHPLYTYASGNKQAFIKGPAGNPWDINLVDSSYVYLWLTENGDEGPSGPGSAWLIATAFKRFPANGKGYPTAQGVPLCPRFFDITGSAVPIPTAGPNNSHRTLLCETDGEPLINIGSILTVTHPPTSMSHGGTIGTRDTIVIEYFYGGGPYNARERFYLVKGVGEVKWDVSSGTYPSSYTVGQTSTFNVKAIGGTPALNFPCSSSVSWWI